MIQTVSHVFRKSILGCIFEKLFLSLTSGHSAALYIISVRSGWKTTKNEENQCRKKCVQNGKEITGKWVEGGLFQCLAKKRSCRVPRDERQKNFFLNASQDAFTCMGTPGETVYIISVRFWLENNKKSKTLVKKKSVQNGREITGN